MHKPNPRNIQNSHKGNRVMDNDCEHNQTEICNGQFKAIHARIDKSDKVTHEKLTKLDNAIRGNGKPGIMTRLDRIEQAKILRSKLAWFFAGTVGAFLVRVLYSVFFGA